MLTVAFMLVAVAAVAYIAVSRYPARTERVFGIFWTARGVAFAVSWLLLGFFALSSGVLPLVLFGMGIYLVAALYILLENPGEVLP